MKIPDDLMIYISYSTTYKSLKKWKVPIETIYIILIKAVENNREVPDCFQQLKPQCFADLVLLGEAFQNHQF